MLKRGKELIQETRHWDDKRRVTIGLRTKEFEKDYRYFPEQDLVPIDIDQKFISKVKKELPEMPVARSKRFQEGYQLSEFDTDNLVLDKDIADFYEEGIKIDSTYGPEEYKIYCNWLMNDISGWLNENNKRIKDTKITPKHLVEIINSIKEGKITGKIAKTFIDEIMKGTPITKIIKESGMKRIADKGTITKIVKDILKDNPKIVEDYKKNPKAIQALIGKCMQKTKGQIDPEITKALLHAELLKLVKS